MKRFFKILLLVIVVLLLAVQLYPKPAKNISATLSAKDIRQKYPVPADAEALLQSACYDCHSNNTRYPWYSKVQPVAWWLGDHINEGKRRLNFSEFLGYRIWKQYHVLEEVEDQITGNEMPLSSYTLIHTDAKLSAAQKAVLIHWSQSVRDSIRSSYPADSLSRPGKK